MVSPNVVKRIPIAIGIKPNQPTTFTNKTIDCGVGNGNTISNIPNSSLVNSSITINGQSVSLGGTTTIPDPTNIPNSSLVNSSITINGQSVSLGGTTTIATPVGLQSRATSSAPTQSIANDTSDDITITAAKSYALLKIETSAAAWVTCYADETSRTNDASRTETTDPTPGSGVIAEVITSGAATQIITPGTIGWNNDATPSSNVYLKVVNKSGTLQPITVTLTYVALEV